MSLEQIFGVVLGVGLVAGVVYLLVVNARRGGVFDWTRNRSAVLEIPRDVDATRALVFDGLQQHLGTNSSKRRTRKRKFTVVSHVGEYGPGSQWYGFALEPLGDRRTRLVVTAQPVNASGRSVPHPDATDARLEQLDAFAAWLAEHGDGHVLHTDWGKGASQSNA